MVFWEKRQWFMKRPGFTSHIRKEFLAHYLGVLPETVQTQMSRLWLSLQELDDCVSYLKMKTKKQIEAKDIQKLASLSDSQ